MNDWDHDIFHLDDEQPQPMRGCALVAKPTVGDYFFKRSVIAIVDPDEGDGAMGVVVNHLAGYLLKDLLPDIPTIEEIPVYLGGPMGPDMLFFMHTLGPELIPDAIDMGDGLWFGGDFDAIRDYLVMGKPATGHIKFILGYSGWGKGQIASELERHDWAVLTDGDRRELYMGEEEEGMWLRAVERFGDRYRLWLNMPSDPSCN